MMNGTQKHPSSRVAPEGRHADLCLIYVGKKPRACRVVHDTFADRMNLVIECKTVADIPSAAEETRVLRIGTGGGKTLARSLISVEAPVMGVDIPVIMGALVDGVHVIIAREGITDAIWELKSEATRLGLPFEVAESRTSFVHLLRGSIEALITSPEPDMRSSQLFHRMLAPYVLQGDPGSSTPALGAQLTTAGLSVGKVATLRALLQQWSEFMPPAQETAEPSLPKSADFAAKETTSELSRSDALGTLPGVTAATHGLRSKRGRLDAEKLSKLFALSRADLARIADVSAEAIRQTPDSTKLQPTLGVLERCARLMVLNPDPHNFRVWLNTANSELAEQTPLEAIKNKRGDMVADLVEDILTNRGG